GDFVTETGIVKIDGKGNTQLAILLSVPAQKLGLDIQPGEAVVEMKALAQFEVLKGSLSHGGAANRSPSKTMHGERMVAGAVKIRHRHDFGIFPGEAGGGELEYFTAFELVRPEHFPLLLLVVNTLEPGFAKSHPEETVIDGIAGNRGWGCGGGGLLQVVGAVSRGRDIFREEHQLHRLCH